MTSRAAPQGTTESPGFNHITNLLVLSAPTTNSGVRLGTFLRLKSGVQTNNLQPCDKQISLSHKNYFIGHYNIKFTHLFQLINIIFQHIHHLSSYNWLG